jgi:hypothetical protein
MEIFLSKLRVFIFQAVAIRDKITKPEKSRLIKKAELWIVSGNSHSVLEMKNIFCIFSSKLNNPKLLVAKTTPEAYQSKSHFQFSKENNEIFPPNSSASLQVEKIFCCSLFSGRQNKAQIKLKADFHPPDEHPKSFSVINNSSASSWALTKTLLCLVFPRFSSCQCQSFPFNYLAANDLRLWAFVVGALRRMLETTLWKINGFLPLRQRLNVPAEADLIKIYRWQICERITSHKSSGIEFQGFAGEIYSWGADVKPAKSSITLHSRKKKGHEKPTRVSVFNFGQPHLPNGFLFTLHLIGGIFPSCYGSAGWWIRQLFQPALLSRCTHITEAGW